MLNKSIKYIYIYIYAELGLCCCDLHHRGICYRLLFWKKTWRGPEIFILYVKVHIYSGNLPFNVYARSFLTDKAAEARSRGNYCNAGVNNTWIITCAFMTRLGTIAVYLKIIRMQAVYRAEIWAMGFDCCEHLTSYSPSIFQNRMLNWIYYNKSPSINTTISWDSNIIQYIWLHV